MAKMVVEHYLDDCIGCGACARDCPSFWEMKKSESLSHLKGSKKDAENVERLELDENKIGCNKVAEEVCPVQCIKIVKK